MLFPIEGRLDAASPNNIELRAHRDFTAIFALYDISFAPDFQGGTYLVIGNPTDRDVSHLGFCLTNEPVREKTNNLGSHQV